MVASKYFTLYNVSFCFMKAALLSFLVIFSVSCSSKIERAVVSVADGSVSADASAVSSGYVLLPGAILAAGAHSYAAVQIKDRGMLILFPDTEITVHEKNIALNKGEIYIALDKGKKLNLHSAAAESSLKGCRTLISSASGSSRIQHYSGSCDIVPVINGRPDDDKEIELHERYSADIIDGHPGSLFPLRENNLRDFSVLASVSPASDPAHVADPVQVIPFNARDLLMRVNADELTKSFELKKLAMSKGPLRLVTLKNGKTYIGAVSVSGKVMQIETVSGKVSVPSKQIVSVTVFE